jgi:hypothetical protein
MFTPKEDEEEKKKELDVRKDDHYGGCENLKSYVLWYIFNA